ncbi:hypothetical protein H2203_002175 [Taxawa tesnikishii (nom. ined.)]|nr:hypothetical protein H2203_002175 [Dothideales sp. JES 119]
MYRYGAEDDLPPQNPLLETMYIPSRILGRNNLEILITSLNSSSGPHGEADPAGLLEAVLVPPLQTPIGFTGRAGFVRNPVHKALIVGDGIEGSLEFGRFEGLLNGTLQGSEVEDDLGQVIKAAINIPRDPTRTLQQIAQYGGVAAVDIEQASAGLELFRKDITNGPEFNAKWQVSNVQGLTSWLTAGSQASFMDTASISQSLHPAISAHVTSILRSASTAIAQSEIVARDSVNSATIPDTTRTYLQAAITNWSQHAHTDLQFSLARATSSRAWRRTSWNRLLWRADDVGVAAEEVLRSYWLLDAEMGLAFLSGRVEEAGFFRNTGGLNNFNPDWVLSQSDRVLGEDGKPVASERSYLAGPGKTAADEEVKEARKGRHWFFGNWLEKVPREPTAPELFRADRMLNRVQQEGGVDLRHSRPWPLAIHYTRQKLLYTLVPTLQRRAQSLVLQSFSTVGATSALGAWIFVVTGGIGIYEAGAVAALGLVWSLRRLQRKWEEARNVWEGEVRESGRVVLSDVEATLRVVIAGNERPVLRTEDVVAWRKARDAVQQVGEELGKLK